MVVLVAEWPCSSHVNVLLLEKKIEMDDLSFASSPYPSDKQKNLLGQLWYTAAQS